MSRWKDNGCDKLEVARRLIDLFFVSVLLDAGAGDHWRYVEPGTGKEFERSEGIAVASLHMFTGLSFSSKKDFKIPVVDGERLRIVSIVQELIRWALGQGLEQLTTEALAQGFQVSDSNPILGLESRANLLRGLGRSLRAQYEIFGAEGRPGNIVGKCIIWNMTMTAHS